MHPTKLIRRNQLNLIGERSLKFKLLKSSRNNMSSIIQTCLPFKTRNQYFSRNYLKIFWGWGNFSKSFGK